MYVFFRASLLWGKRRKGNQGRGGEMRLMKKNVVTIIVAFFSGLCLIDLNTKFVIWRAFIQIIFDSEVWLSCKAIRARRKLKILCLIIVNTATSVVCSISDFFFFLKIGNSNKSPLDATAQTLFIVLEEDHRLAETITLNGNRMKM